MKDKRPRRGDPIKRWAYSQFRNEPKEHQWPEWATWLITAAIIAGAIYLRFG